jgi:hypothetical protein
MTAAGLADVVVTTTVTDLRPAADALGVEPVVLALAAAQRLAREVLREPLCEKCARRVLDAVEDIDATAALLCSRCRGWTRCIGAFATTRCTGDAKAPTGRQWCAACSDTWSEYWRELPAREARAADLQREARRQRTGELAGASS